MSTRHPDRVTEVHRDGLVLDVIDEGPLDGDPVVLLHGFPERATCWRSVAPLLHAQGLRTLALDQRGYSPRARPRGRRAYRVAELSADVAALLDLLVGEPGPGGVRGQESKVHVVGHDWGAIVAWHVATTRPDLVRSLTAFSVPHPAAFVSSLVSSRQGLRSWYVGAFQLPGGAEWLAGRGTFERLLRRGGMSADEVARFRREILDDGALPGGLAWYRALPWTDREAARQQVTVPTTMVWSDGDSFIDRGAVERCGRHVDAPYRLVVMPGVTHWIPTQAPEPAAAAILARAEAS